MINSLFESFINNNDINKKNIKNYLNTFLNPIKYYLILLIFIFLCFIYYIIKIDNKIQIIINNLILLKKMND